MKVTIGISNRHVHLTKEDLYTLFKIESMETLKPINQPGQFASTKKVDVKTEKSIIKGIRVLGPCRDYTQVEISKTDAFQLGINPPVRESGDLDNAEVVTIIGEFGEITKPCAIIADRHIHLTKEEKESMGLTDHYSVSVEIGKEKSSIINNVRLKVSEKSYYEMHIDTDDANANLISNGDIGEIVIIKK
ncbi:MAG: phosphate propanoyltransferase [Bacilli bacterium]|nr:phosphate propanoyltransferase [Bacilli bacterium]